MRRILGLFAVFSAVLALAAPALAADHGSPVLGTGIDDAAFATPRVLGTERQRLIEEVGARFDLDNHQLGQFLAAGPHLAQLVAGGRDGRQRAVGAIRIGFGELARPIGLAIGRHVQQWAEDLVERDLSECPFEGEVKLVVEREAPGALDRGESK